MRILLFLFSIPVILFGCSGASLKDYETKSMEEEEIKTILNAYERAWNEHNASKLLALLHEKFIIWAENERSIVSTKKKYAFMLRDRMREYRVLRLGKPAIWIKDDKATVVLTLSVDGRNIRNKFYLIRVNGKWLFLSSEF